MHYQTLQRRFSRLTGRITMIGALSLLAPTLQAASFSVPVTPPSLPIHHFWDDLQLDLFPGDAWERLRKSLAWQDRRDDARVQEWIERFRAQPHSIATIIERARPWMAWITEQVERRNLPGEVSLIPFIESAYDPKARNPSGAAGLWQFMPRTAEALGLQRHTGYDGRLDVVAATYAALDYIELQAEQWYEGDIELSLA
ncbi:MAG TPA: transglycosylase SLT domain-containing protein, partial [Candidatus Halomonas stercoripullorum]|nr:transglycosylase SLT domain-containing protein [Candidatus Halomonas stercoripullorum]